MYEMWLHREKDVDITPYIIETIKQIENLHNFTHLATVYPYQLFYETNPKGDEVVYIGKNEQLIDLYRQIGNFKKAEEILDNCFKNYNFKSDRSVLFTYLKQEEKLIKEKNTEHI